MKLNDYLLKNKNKLNNLEENFLINIYFKDFGEKGLDFITPQVKINKPLGEGVWYIDFTINTKYRKYAIECDGLYSHAKGAVTPEYFENLQKKQNEIIKLGYKLIRFTNKMVREKPEECIWEIRRDVLADKQLSDIYLKRVGKITPHQVQIDALKKLKETRENGQKKGLIIFATGLGKTYLSGFDVKQFTPKKVLFIVHIYEILKQSKNSFEDVLPKRIKEMGFFIGSNKEKNKNIIFASIQTLSRQKNLNNFNPTDFDYIIFDESHHIAAPTYKKIFLFFKPKFFLGLTATPDRMDRQDILPFYDNNVIFEMNQEEAIKKGYLVPFHYYGFKDDVDYSNIYYNGFKYDVTDLNKLLLIEERDEAIIKKYTELAPNKKTIGFCASIEHADWCAEKFREAGISAVSIHSRLDESDTPIDLKDRDQLIEDFRKNKYKVAFVVNMFNEGVDFPEVECLLFLRPTESKTIFIQHMGRGLRISPGKNGVTILDFIGNYKTAGLILAGLGIKNPNQLEVKKTGEKEIYTYDNNGCKVTFESEVIDIFKKLASQSTKEVRTELISEEWLEYGKYLEKWTKKNLYWKTTQQNANFEVHMEALNILDQNPKITQDDFITKIQETINSKYKGKNMTAGFRSLFLSKITGFVTSKSPLKVTSIFKEVKKLTTDFRKLSSYEDILTKQMEKIFYWNDIYSTVNKYIKKEDRVNYKDFKIYPFFFLYEIILKLVDDFGYKDYYINKDEFNNFLAVSKNHQEVDKVVEKIIEFRNDSEKYEVEKYLNLKNKIDPRFYKVLHYNKHIIQLKDGIRLNPNTLDEIKDKVKVFKKLIEEEKLIFFDEEHPKKYFDLLYSTKDLLKYHDNNN
jgi:superfamily II DNA or RNA helicase